MFSWTGHPFVDGGLVALLLYSGKTRPEELTQEDIEKAIKFASELYSRKEWSSSYLHALLFPNSGLLMANPSMTKKRTPENIAKNLESLLQEKEDPSTPLCEICGRRHSRSKPVYRSEFPLIGSGGVPNYFPSGKDGANICSHCLFLVQFMPLILYRLPRLLLIHTYPPELMLELHREALNDVLLTRLVSSGRGYKRPENFLFTLLTEVSLKTEDEKLWENASITLYYFTNPNRGRPEMTIIHVPSTVTRFVAHAARHDRAGWERIVAMGWRKGRENEKVHSNEVYQKLLSGESILPYFINMTERKPNASWNLLFFYCTEVLGLNKEALEFIKEVGDRIVETLKELPDNKLSARVRELERSEKLYQFEAFFVNLEKLRQRLGLKGSLMTFDEFARLLTTYGEDLEISWRTVRNLLLFRIYEKLHDRLAKVEASEETEFYGAGEEVEE
ncbi:type I-B CRISPR-associated protein Cas8b1/Cst1 [Pyrococcus horikoshii]|uniref:CRISPR-associated protein CXXC-CXXC domain-containing protein n=2 Tax=Pyrococcus horikoshii TaxID=53953 RepID=O58932_PYRHO|nr:type I-B CRISPR-associated protein Cas8b1/Cst1 [Pyrococcus horikoshii]BAA30352.1 446aa long hypothetical protein [Pyrococcus horikoshii OT3]HII60262.1 type I-B CRISPR-associated protein Cas8b1/Cst1 [Pyrococcus horikoshii]